MYRVLRNGEPLYGSEGNLTRVIRLIRYLEQDIDRLTQHSPFTIVKICNTPA